MGLPFVFRLQNNGCLLQITLVKVLLNWPLDDQGEFTCMKIWSYYAVYSKAKVGRYRYHTCCNSKESPFPVSEDLPLPTPLFTLELRELVRRLKSPQLPYNIYSYISQYENCPTWTSWKVLQQTDSSHPVTKQLMWLHPLLCIKV